MLVNIKNIKNVIHDEMKSVGTLGLPVQLKLQTATRMLKKTFQKLG